MAAIVQERVEQGLLDIQQQRGWRDVLSDIVIYIKRMVFDQNIEDREGYFKFKF